MPRYRQVYGGKEFSITVDGLAQAERNLRTLDKKARTSILRKANTAGGRVLVKHARRQAPVDKGNLKKTIRQRTRIMRGKGAALTSIKPRATKRQREKGIDAFYAHMVIGGTKPHDLGSRGNLAVPEFADHPYTRINHPGIRPNNFMWRAAQSGSRESIAAYRGRFVPLVEEAARNLPKT